MKSIDVYIYMYVSFSQKLNPEIMALKKYQMFSVQDCVIHARGMLRDLKKRGKIHELKACVFRTFRESRNIPSAWIMQSYTGEPFSSCCL